MEFVAMCVGGLYHGRTVCIPWKAAEARQLTRTELASLLAALRGEPSENPGQLPQAKGGAK